MERICYCPSEEHMEEAEELATPWGVHIQLGESDRTEPFEFDRSKTQILNLPTEQHFAISAGRIKPYETIACNYVDEFSLVNNVNLVYENDDGFTEVAPMHFGDPHFIGWRFRFPSPGDYKVRIFDEDGDIAFEEVRVDPW